MPHAKAQQLEQMHVNARRALPGQSAPYPQMNPPIPDDILTILRALQANHTYFLVVDNANGDGICYSNMNPADLRALLTSVLEASRS